MQVCLPFLFILEWLMPSVVHSVYTADVAAYAAVKGDQLRVLPVASLTWPSDDVAGYP